jgi:Domain of unknown function (DUF4224)
MCSAPPSDWLNYRLKLTKMNSGPLHQIFIKDAGKYTPGYIRVSLGMLGYNITRLNVFRRATYGAHQGPRSVGKVEVITAAEAIDRRCREVDGSARDAAANPRRLNKRAQGSRSWSAVSADRYRLTEPHPRAEESTHRVDRGHPGRGSRPWQAAEVRRQVSDTFLSDFEVLELCHPLVQSAAMLRHLKSLGIAHRTRPDGRPIVSRRAVEDALCGATANGAAGRTNEPDKAALMARLGKRKK